MCFLSYTIVNFSFLMIMMKEGRDRGRKGGEEWGKEVGRIDFRILKKICFNIFILSYIIWNIGFLR